MRARSLCSAAPFHVGQRSSSGRAIPARPRRRAAPFHGVQRSAAGRRMGARLRFTVASSGRRLAGGCACRLEQCPRVFVSQWPAIGGRQEDGRVGWSSVNPRYAISRCPAIGGRQEDTRVAWSTVRVSSFHGGQRSAAGRTVVPKMSSPHGVTKHVR